MHVPAAAQPEKPAEPERAASAEPPPSPSPAPKPDYNFARAGLPDENDGAPSTAAQGNPEQPDPYSFALAPLPDADLPQQNGFQAPPVSQAASQG